MRLDLSCPIELRGYALTGENGQTCAALRLYNLSNRKIDSFEAVAKWRSAAGRCLACPFTAARLRASGESMFSYALSTDRLPDAVDLELMFTAVRFESGEEWRAGNGPFAEIEPLPFLSAEELSRLRQRLGEDAVCDSRQDEETWLCACGRTNANETGRCARCHRTREEALSGKPESASAEPPSAESASPSFEALQTRTLRRHARLLHRTFVIAIAALAATVLLVLNASPSPSVQAGAASEVVFSNP